eukprot:633770-Prymnesium_polylepis.1
MGQCLVPWAAPWDIATAARCAAHAFRAHSACDSHDTRRDDGHTRHQHNHKKHTKAPITTPQHMGAGGGSTQHHQFWRPDIHPQPLELARS